MHTLHTVYLRSTNNEAKSRGEHLSVFREFIEHLDRSARRQPIVRSSKRVKVKTKNEKR